MAADKNMILMKGKVIAVLPNAMFTVRLENGHDILGRISGKIHLKKINILLNDVVDVEISPYDITKGRIIYRRKKEDL